MSGHTVTTEPSRQHVRVTVGGEEIAASDRALELHETGLPTRFYIPVEDVRADVLEPSEHTSHCPFKGDASYYSVRVNGDVVENAAWYYPEPIDAVAEIAGYLSFYPEKVELVTA